MSEGGPVPIGAAEAAALVGPAAAGDGAGVLVGCPVLAVYLDDPVAVADVSAAVGSVVAVVVGVLPHEAPPGLDPHVLARFDLLLGPEGASARDDPAGASVVRDGDVEDLVARIAAGVAHSPAASVTLAQLLRAGDRLTLVDAVVAESWAYSMLQSGPDHRSWLATREPGPPCDDADAVRVRRLGDRLEVTLTRPHVHNAVDRHLRDELHSALVVALADPTVTSVHLRGDGVSFCSGGDLDEFGSAPDPVTAHLVRTTRSPALALAAIAERGRAGGTGRTELVAHVQGAAIGAGMEWAAFADRVIARDDARFRLPEVAMGLVPGAGGTASIPKRIGRHRTLWLALSGEELDATTAQAWGLVDEVVDTDAFSVILAGDELP